MTKEKKSPKRRNGDLAMIHIAAKRLFGDVSKSGDGREAYEDWLERHTGKRSAGKLTIKERMDFVKYLRKEGLLPERGQGGSGADRPTRQQWAMMGGLARDMGWENGLEDARLKSFVERTTGLSSTRFLKRDTASQVITGLQNWVRQNAQHGGGDAMS